MSSLAFNIQRVNALPTTYEAQTLYFVKSQIEGLFDLYITGTDPTSVYHAVNSEDIQKTMTALLNANDNVVVVPDIAARDALTPNRVEMAVVLDATGDPDVTVGSASYVYYPATTNWIKVAEYETMHMVIQWANVEGRPTSAPEDIDTAVNQSHTHDNKAVLDQLTDDGNGGLKYKGVTVGAPLIACEW